MSPRIVRASKPLLATIPNVELLDVGEDWTTSTGVFTFTEDDVVSAVNAAAPGSNIPIPVLKFGHTDPRFGMADGEFAIGRIENVRLSENKLTLMGDYVGVPVWLAEIMPYAYPRRSIEGEWKGLGRVQGTWDGFHLTAIALLGAYYPACATLEDLEAFWTGEDFPMYDADTGEMVALSSVVAATTSLREDHMPSGTTNRQQRRAAAKTTRKVAAGTAVEDVRRAWYEDEADGWSDWIRAMYVDPPELIWEDADGDLYRQPYTITGDEVTFGESEKVKIEYVAAARVAAGVRAGQEAVAVYPTPEASRPDTVSATNPTREDIDVKLSDKVIEALGLDPKTATDEEIAAVLEERAESGFAPDDGGEATTDVTNIPGEGKDPEPNTETQVNQNAPELKLPEGMVIIDQATLDELKAGSQAGRDVAAKLAEQDRDDVLEKAVKAGKFPRARLGHYRDAWDADPVGTRATIAKLAAGLVPVTERGQSDKDNDAANPGGEAYPASWLPKAAQKRLEGGLTITNEKLQEAK